MINQPIPKQIYIPNSSIPNNISKNSLEQINMFGETYYLMPVTLFHQEKTFHTVFKEMKALWFPKLNYYTKKNYLCVYKKLSPIYHIPISQIKIADLQVLINPYISSFSVKKNLKIILNKTFEYAVKYDYIPKNHTRYLDLGTNISKKTRKVWTNREINKLWAVSDNYFAKITLLMIYTGMRIGEVRTLKKSNIHIKKKYSYIVGGSKTINGKDRYIPICDKIKPIVIDLLNEAKGDTLINTKLQANAFNIHLRRAMKRLNFNHKSHDARHTFSSKMRALGVAPDITQKIIGHKCNSLLLDTYTHYTKKLLHSAVNKLN